MCYNKSFNPAFYAYGVMEMCMEVSALLKEHVHDLRVEVGTGIQ